jgi:hypothetical protein
MGARLVRWNGLRPEGSVRVELQQSEELGLFIGR